jgi:hypothetical protein
MERAEGTTEFPSGASPLGVKDQPCPSCGGAAAADCPTCKQSAASSVYVYALGRIEHHFPSPAIEKELAQAAKHAPTEGLTDGQRLHRVLSERSNRYIVRQLCWVLTIEEQDTYILVPRDPADWDLLVAALRPTPSPMDLNAVIGIRGRTAPPDMCNGLTLPIVSFDQLYHFDRQSLIKAIPPPDKIKSGDFEPAAEELLDRILQMTGNTGAKDAHRALNYLAVRDPHIYAKTAEALGRNASLSAVDIRPSQLGGGRNIVEVIFSYTNRATDVVEKFRTRVDVTDEFPFLVTRMSPYYDL